MTSSARSSLNLVEGNETHIATNIKMRLFVAKISATHTGIHRIRNVSSSSRGIDPGK